MKDEKTGKRLISNRQIRDVLLNASEEFRSQVVWHLERWSSEVPVSPEQDWSKLSVELLRDAWPLQKSVRTPMVSARLCNLAFSNSKQFPRISEVIMPLLTSIDRDNISLPAFARSNGDVIRSCPKQSLSILHKILPDNVDAWPWDIQEVLRQIGNSDDGLKFDERFIELNRKWNSR